ncbi:MAG: M48 family metallopeptidase [Lachnospiraceae bacterium]|jgi:predicted metal-dependent hydrolase|nr:M48 family metallopeptidase [Lachnospiraceae bacterium]
MEYTLIRSKRKTLTVYIRPDATVEVRAPLHLSSRNIEQFLSEKEDWINKKVALVRETNASKNSFHLDFGDKLLFLGKEYPLFPKDGDRIGFDQIAFYAPISIDEETLRQNLIRLYKSLAKKYLNAKAKVWALKMNVSFNSIRITSAATRWGSCSSKKTINFSWRLIMAEEPVIDYVIIHELAHLTELNHSERFWNIVGTYCPDYKACKRKLRELQAKIRTEVWD